METGRVVITGIGLINPLGASSGEIVARLRRAECGAAVEAESGAGMATVGPFAIEPIMKNPKNAKLLSKPVRMGLVAAHQALEQSGLPAAVRDSERTGVFAASGQTGLDYEDFFKALTLAWEKGRAQDYKYLGGMPSKFLDRYFSLRTLSNAGVAAVSSEFGPRGSSNNFVQGETAGAAAIWEASIELLEGRADAAVVFGYESLLAPSNLMAYRTVGLLSGDGLSARYTPFGKGRNGLVLGEGAAALVLETEEQAAARGAKALAAIEGVGIVSQTEDTLAFTPPAEDLRCAIESAGGAEGVDFVFARGLGTEADDAAEAAALGAVLRPGTAVTGIKGSTGYLGAATAITELSLGVLAARQGFIPSLPACSEADPAIDLELVHGGAKELAVERPRGLFLGSTFAGQAAAIRAEIFRERGMFRENGDG